MTNRFSPGCQCECAGDPGQLVAGACNWRVPSSWTMPNGPGLDVGEVSITVPNVPGFGGGGTYVILLKGTPTSQVAGFVDSAPSGGFFYRVSFSAQWSFVFGRECRFDASIVRRAVGGGSAGGVLFQEDAAFVDWRNVNTMRPNPRNNPAGPATWFAIP